MSKSINVKQVSIRKVNINIRRLQKDVEQIEKSRFVLGTEQINGQQRIEFAKEEWIFQVVLCHQHIETMQRKDFRSVVLCCVGARQEISEQEWIRHAWYNLCGYL
jgi:hypothetical protein